MKSAWDRMDAVFASVPQDATAARVTSKGEHFEPTVEYAGHEHHDVPPQIISICKALPSAKPIIAELTGKRFGRLTVIGLAKVQAQSGTMKRKQHARWAVRCACGDYEFRTAKAIRNPTNTDDMCRKCRQVEVNKKRYDRDGGRGWEEFVPELKGDAQ